MASPDEHAPRSAFLIIYLGPLPDYFDFFARTCLPNKDLFHWFVYTDQVTDKKTVNDAVTLVPMTFERLRQQAMEELDIRIPVQHTRIVCDCRLLLYSLRKTHEPLEEYDFIGYSDLDVLYGRIGNFLPPDMQEYVMISGHDHRPCGPFTLFNRRFLESICAHESVRAFFEQDPGEGFYTSEAYNKKECTFMPMSGNTAKDRTAERICFAHLDESESVTAIAEQLGPVLCQADPLQPAMTGGINHRKAFAVWDNGRLVVQDILGRKKEGAFFHFSRFKNRSRFKVNPAVLEKDRFGIYKYGFIPVTSSWTKLKLWATLLY